ncbi:MAG TPA: transporter, partial [Gillisia sp.]|nr:transporter [Gillisia sp.]
ASGYTGGLSFNVNSNFAIDASLLYVRFKEVQASYDPYFENGQQVPFEGTYKSSAIVPGLGITYKL